MAGADQYRQDVLFQNLYISWFPEEISFRDGEIAGQELNLVPTHRGRHQPLGACGCMRKTQLRRRGFEAPLQVQPALPGKMKAQVRRDEFADLGQDWVRNAWGHG